MPILNNFFGFFQKVFKKKVEEQELPDPPSVYNTPLRFYNATNLRRKAMSRYPASKEVVPKRQMFYSPNFYARIDKTTNENTIKGDSEKCIFTNKDVSRVKALDVSSRTPREFLVADPLAGGDGFCNSAPFFDHSLPQKDHLPLPSVASGSAHVPNRNGKLPSGPSFAHCHFAANGNFFGRLDSPLSSRIPVSRHPTPFVRRPASTTTESDYDSTHLLPVGGATRTASKGAAVSRHPTPFVPRSASTATEYDYDSTHLLPVGGATRTAGKSAFVPAATKSQLNSRLENLFRLVSGRRYCGNILDSATHVRWMKLAGIAYDHDAAVFKKCANGRVVLTVKEYKQALDELCEKHEMEYWDVVRRMTEVNFEKFTNIQIHKVHNLNEVSEYK